VVYVTPETFRVSLDIEVSFSLWLLCCAREAEIHNAVSFLGMTIGVSMPLVTTFDKNIVLTPP
jgi:hypothetical protein